MARRGRTATIYPLRDAPKIPPYAPDLRASRIRLNTPRGKAKPRLHEGGPIPYERSSAGITERRRKSHGDGVKRYNAVPTLSPGATTRHTRSVALGSRPRRVVRPGTPASGHNSNEYGRSQRGENNNGYSETIPAEDRQHQTGKECAGFGGGAPAGGGESQRPAACERRATLGSRSPRSTESLSRARSAAGGGRHRDSSS